MWRALQLAGNGEGRVSPNPMVGAVIVYEDRIIGEGFHAFFGGPHAEVNAIRNVKPKDREFLSRSTIYVTLEPCAHYGKTPPCANLIVATGIPEVVIGSLDPNPLVAGKGVKILEDAGIKVTSGVLEKECRELNRSFMYSQLHKIPFITLKWAQSADGFMASITEDGVPEPVKFSSPVSSVWVHRLRASNDAILVGGNTERIDRPQLNTRLWGGNSPKKYVAHYDMALLPLLEQMRKEGITSLIVEGGPTLLAEFIKNNWYNEIRIEVSPMILGKGLPPPAIPQNVVLEYSYPCGENIISCYRR